MQRSRSNRLRLLYHIPKDLPLTDPGPAKTITMQSPWGEVVMVAPVVQYSETKAYWELPPAPFGAHKPEWAAKG